MRRLVNELSKLPSVGEKSAVRLAYHLLTKSKDDSLKLAKAIEEACAQTRLCEVCYAMTDDEVCHICLDRSRIRDTLCVVEKPSDVIALERTGGYRGLYHVLHGVWAPLKGISPEHTKLGALLKRLEKSQQHSADAEETKADPTIREIVLATSTTVEGDATALYIANCVSLLGVRVTRIAQGLPKGGELEYADDITLSHAIDGRRQL